MGFVSPWRQSEPGALRKYSWKYPGPESQRNCQGSNICLLGDRPDSFLILIKEMRNEYRQRVSVSNPDTPALRLILFLRSESDPPPGFLAINIQRASNLHGQGTAWACEQQQQQIPARGLSCVMHVYEA